MKTWKHLIVVSVAICAVSLTLPAGFPPALAQNNPTPSLRGSYGFLLQLDSGGALVGVIDFDGEGRCQVSLLGDSPQECFYEHDSLQLGQIVVDRGGTALVTEFVVADHGAHLYFTTSNDCLSVTTTGGCHGEGTAQ